MLRSKSNYWEVILEWFLDDKKSKISKDNSRYYSCAWYEPKLFNGLLRSKTCQRSTTTEKSINISRNSDFYSINSFYTDHCYKIGGMREPFQWVDENSNLKWWQKRKKITDTHYCLYLWFSTVFCLLSLKVKFCQNYYNKRI